MAILCVISLISCSAIVRTEYVKPIIPSLPEKPVYYSVVFDNDLKLTEQYARNLLKNRELDLGYTRQLEIIIEGLR